ncbi:MAG: hypothetical protein IT234_04800 [Bacteroidia bacterium]|nr:hypothetical protein [Bacteroidia bacterium]
MSQLHALIQTLNEPELTSLRSQRLIGKEKEVFDYVIKNKDSELPETGKVQQSLKLTESHYYKINSVLLRKCYQLLVPEDGIDLLLFLRSKNLFTLLRHEILSQEKKNGDKNNTTFYLKCFHLCIDFPYKYYDEKMTAQFGEKYLRSKKDCTLSDKLYVKYHLMFSAVNRTAARKNPIKALGFGIKDLFKHEKELEKSNHHLAKYYLYRSICSYYSYYEKNNDMIIAYLKKAIALKDHIAYFFSVNIEQFLQLQYADALLNNNEVDQAEKIYASAFKQGVEPSMYGYYYHCEQYILVLIIQGEFVKAEELLKKIFEPCIQNKIDIYATRGAMSYVKLYLSSGDYKSALKYLNIGKVINEKTFYLPFDVQLRVLENVYFFMKKDYDFALQLANRNIKFIRSQEQNPVLEDYVKIWRMIITLINKILKEEEITEIIKEENRLLSREYANLYCRLFPLILEQAVNETT